MNNRPSTNQLLLFLTPLLLGAGIKILNLVPHRFAILPAGAAVKNESANTEKAVSEPPATKVVLEVPPNTLPIIRYNKK